MSTADMARATGKAYKVVDDYLSGRKATPVSVLLLMTRALNVRVDAVFRRAGLESETVSVEEAMDSDRRLPPKNRDAAKTMYRSLLREL